MGSTVGSFFSAGAHSNGLRSFLKAYQPESEIFFRVELTDHRQRLAVLVSSGSLFAVAGGSAINGSESEARSALNGTVA